MSASRSVRGALEVRLKYERGILQERENDVLESQVIITALERELERWNEEDEEVVP